MSVPSAETITATGITTSQAKQLSDGSPDGVCLGQSATDKVGFFGTAPVVKQTLGGEDITNLLVALRLMGLIV